MTIDNKAVLLELLGKTEKATTRLKTSFDKCSRFDFIDKITDDELETLESLTARFARLSDIIIKKIFRIIEKIDLDSPSTIRDSILLAEKKELIESAELFFRIRELRNMTAHDYEENEEALIPHFKEIIYLTPYLFDSFDRIKTYTKKY
ncbi:MAG: nucleotidyltransferase substrate binding protein [Melioribacteraceae bacterium]|nr:nucleotidyltransferase substrate binding protein [Melioribacteraceae bacterium]